MEMGHLVISRKPIDGLRAVICGEVKFELVEIMGNSVRIRITAPKSTVIVREELIREEQSDE